MKIPHRTGQLPLGKACLLAAVTVTAAAPAWAQGEQPPAPVGAMPPAQSAQNSATPQALECLIEAARPGAIMPRAAGLSAEAARLRLQAANQGPRPTFTLVPGLAGGREGRDEEMLLAQPLELFGERGTRRQRAGAELRRAQAGAELAGLAWYFAARRSGVALYAAQELATLAGEQLELGRQFHAAARRRAGLGEVPAVQAEQLELEVWRLELALNRAQATVRAHMVEFNQLLGRAPLTPVRLLPPAPLGSDLPSTDAASPAGELSPDLRWLAAGTEARRAELAALRQEGRPRAEVQLRRSAILGREGQTALRAMVVVPLFGGPVSRNARRALETEIEAKQLELEQGKRVRAARLEAAGGAVTSARQEVALFQENLVPRALDLLRKARIGYEQGASSLLEVLEAQRSVSQLRAEYAGALERLRIGELQMEMVLRGLGAANSVAVTAMGTDEGGPR